MDIFKKGNYKLIPPNFRMKGIEALKELSAFQEEFQIFDTDTTINEIRDSIVAHYLGFELLNFDKHGFDAKKLNKEEYLEVKQCSLFSKSWGGTWNDTTPDKAKAFSDNRVFIAIGVWKGASNLQFIVFGQNPKIGEYLLQRVKAVANSSTRSTQTISIQKLIKEYGFDVVIPPDKTKNEIQTLLINYSRQFAKLNLNFKEIKDV